MIDTLMSWLVCLLPRSLCAWLWLRSETNGRPLGRWAPHIFGWCVGSDAAKARKP